MLYCQQAFPTNTTRCQATRNMSESEAVTDSSIEPPPGGQIDFTKYQTAALAERLTELLSVPGALRRIAETTFLVLILTAFVCSLIFTFSEITLLPGLVLSAYSLVAGFFLGLLLGLLRILSKTLHNIESILALVLEVTGKVATDYEQVQTGKSQLPSGGELVEQVYTGVVLPALEKVVANLFGPLSTPLLWLYRRTIGSAVHYVVKRVAAIQITSESAQLLKEKTKSGLASVSNYSETITNYTASAMQVVNNIGRKIRFYAMLPTYALFILALVLATAPILVVRYFLSS